MNDVRLPAGWKTLIAREYDRPTWGISWIRTVDLSATSFGDYRIDVDIPLKTIHRVEGNRVNVLAKICDGAKGKRLDVFRGTIESDGFILKLRRQHFLSRAMNYEVVLKETGKVFSSLSLGNIDEELVIGNLLTLRTKWEKRRCFHYVFQVEGSYDPACRDLAEIMACFLFHRNRPSESS